MLEYRFRTSTRTENPVDFIGGFLIRAAQTNAVLAVPWFYFHKGRGGAHARRRKDLPLILIRSGPTCWHDGAKTSELRSSSRQTLK